MVLRVHGASVEKVLSGDDILSTHYATSVQRNGFLYGINGRNDPGFKPGPECGVRGILREKSAGGRSPSSPARSCWRTNNC